MMKTRQWIFAAISIALSTAQAQKAGVVPPAQLPPHGDVSAFAGTYTSETCIGAPASIKIETYWVEKDKTYLVHVVDTNTRKTINDYLLGSMSYLSRDLKNSISVATLIDGKTLLANYTVVPLVPGQTGSSGSVSYTIEGKTLTYAETWISLQGGFDPDANVFCTYVRS